MRLAGSGYYNNYKQHFDCRFLIIIIMNWTSLIYGVTLLCSVLAIPVSFDGDNSRSKIENDILSQSEISSRQRRADETSPATLSTTVKEDLTTDSEMPTTDIRQVRKLEFVIGIS